MDDLRDEAHQLGEGVRSLTLSVNQLAERTRRSERLITGLGVSLALSVLLILALAGLGWKVYAIASCQADQNRAFQAAAVAGRDAAALDRQGQRELLDAILNPAATQDERRTAVESYRSYLVEAEKVRAGNPLPPPADCR